MPQFEKLLGVSGVHRFADAAPCSQILAPISAPLFRHPAPATRERQSRHQARRCELSLNSSATERCDVPLCLLWTVQHGHKRGREARSTLPLLPFAVSTSGKPHCSAIATGPCLWANSLTSAVTLSGTWQQACCRGYPCSSRLTRRDVMVQRDGCRCPVTD